jgi:hypothetical protein
MSDAPGIASNFSGSLSCRVQHQHGFSATLEDEASALVERMDEMNSDEDSMGRRSIKLAGEDCNAFRAFGVIHLFDDETVCSGRKMQLQIAVNGRPSAQAKQLAEIIQDNIKKYFGGNSCESIVFHPSAFITLDMNYLHLYIDSILSLLSIILTQIQRLASFT